MKTIYFSLIASVLLLSGCVSPPITMNQIQSIQRGDTRAKVHKLVPREPEAVIKAKYASHHYLGEFQKMETGTQEETIPSCTQYGCVYVTENVPVSAVYIFLYRQKLDKQYHLYTWGFIEKLHKSSSKAIRTVIKNMEAQRRAMQQI